MLVFHWPPPADRDRCQPEQESEAAKQIRTSILQAVGALHAYLPPPGSDMLYFKRMLVKMQARDEASLRWYAPGGSHAPPALLGSELAPRFPWGIPPVVPLKEAYRTGDPLLQNYAGDLLKLLAPQQPLGKK